MGGLAAKGLRSQPKPPLAAGCAAGACGLEAAAPAAGAASATGGRAAAEEGAGNGAACVGWLAGACCAGGAIGAGAGSASGTAGVAGAATAGCAGVGVGFFLKKLNIGRYLESLHSMKRAFPLLGLLACLSAGAQSPVSPTPFATPPSAQSAQAATASGAQQFTLANGMQLIVQPDRRAPTAMHMVWLRVGSMDEVDGTSGVAHVLEHMMFKGTKTVPPGEFSRRVAALGGQENAFTSRDYTGYYQQIPAHRLEDVMRLESDRFAHNQWPDDEFKREIEVVKEERRLRTDDKPRSLVVEQLMATAFQAHPYRRPIIGWMSDLENMTASDARDWYTRWYVPNNATLVVVGDVDHQAVFREAARTYGAVKARALPARWLPCWASTSTWCRCWAAKLRRCRPTVCRLRSVCLRAWTSGAARPSRPMPASRSFRPRPYGFAGCSAGRQRSKITMTTRPSSACAGEGFAYLGNGLPAPYSSKLKNFRF